MQISQLLRHKGREVATIDGTETVRTALGILAEKGIGALVVSSDGQRIDGIVSERDVARGLHSHGAGLLAETEEMGLRGDRLGGYAGITKARSVIGHGYWGFLVRAVSGATGNEAVHTHAGRGTSARQACRTQDLATIHRHAGEPSAGGEHV